MKISVIFTTYNSPEWLEKVLWGWEQQSDQNFEIVIADDGSGRGTIDVIDEFVARGKLDIQHIWQEDEGFQKCKILNKALVAAKGEYIVMTDGDCIPRQDFLAEHRKHASPGYFLSGGYFKLPMHVSQSITYDDIVTGQCFAPQWLRRRGVKLGHRVAKLNSGPIQAAVLNRLIPTRKTWNGHNASCFKVDALKVNGFDERMKYGGLDAEFGGRLENSGLKVKRVRYNAICLHLDHGRGYANPEDMARNRTIREASLKNKVIETPAGIKQHRLA